MKSTDYYGMKNCPFCGGEADLTSLGFGKECSPYCTKCKASIPIWFKDESYALKAWNDRVNIQKSKNEDNSIFKEAIKKCREEVYFNGYR